MAHTLKIVITGDHNPAATPIDGQYPVEIIRKRLNPDEVYSTTLRYNPSTGQVEYTPDGGTTWVPSPESDPRNQTTRPPQSGAGADCNSAASEVAYLVRLLTLARDALNVGATAFQLGSGLIQLLVELGPWGILLDVAVTAATAIKLIGVPAIEALLDPDTLDVIRCAIFCHLSTSNQVNDDRLGQIETDLSTMLPSDQATIVNALLSLQGAGGVNNAMAMNLDTGDCTDCGCGWCFEWDFTIASGDWDAYFDTARNVNRGTWTPGGWRATYLPPPGTESTELMIRKVFSGTVTQIDVTYTRTMGVNGGATDQLVRNSPNGYYNGTVFGTTASTSGTRTWTITGTFSITTELTLWMFAALRTSGSGNPGGSLTVTKVRLQGTGSNPFGANNC